MWFVTRGFVLATTSLMWQCWAVGGDFKRQGSGYGNEVDHATAEDAHILCEYARVGVTAPLLVQLPAGMFCTA